MDISRYYKHLHRATADSLHHEDILAIHGTRYRYIHTYIYTYTYIMMYCMHTKHIHGPGPRSRAGPGDPLVARGPGGAAPGPGPKIYKKSRYLRIILILLRTSWPAHIKFEGVCLNSRHPDPRRLMTLFPLDPADPPACSKPGFRSSGLKEDKHLRNNSL